MSLLDIDSSNFNREVNPAIISSFFLDLHIQTVPNKIYDYEVTSTEYSVICYTFLQDTSYIGILTATFMETSNEIASVSFSKKKYIDEAVLTQNSMLDCQLNPQELTINCLAWFEFQTTKVVSISLKFSFEEEQGLIPTKDYTLKLPNEYTLVNMSKGITTDILIMNYGKSTKALFYDVETQKIISEIDINNMAPNFDAIGIAHIEETSKYMFTFAVPGANYKDFRFVRKTPKVILTNDAFARSDYEDYYLEIQGLKGRKEKFKLDNIFLLETKTNLAVYIVLSAILLICIIGFFCIVCCYYWWSPSSNDEYSPRKKHKDGALMNDDSIMTTVDDSRLPVTRFSRLDSNYKKALFNFNVESVKD